MDGKSRPHPPPPFRGEDAGMADVFAAAIGSAGAKREAQFERLAVAPDVLDAHGIILVGTTFGALVSSEQVDPRSTDAGLEGRVFVHGRGADSAVWDQGARRFAPMSGPSRRAGPLSSFVEPAASRVAMAARWPWQLICCVSP